MEQSLLQFVLYVRAELPYISYFSYNLGSLVAQPLRTIPGTVHTGTLLYGTYSTYRYNFA